MVRKNRQPNLRQPRHRHDRLSHPLWRKAGDYGIGVDQNVSPTCRTSKIGEIGSFLLVYQRVVAHWRAIVLLLILACVVFLVARFDEFIPFMLIVIALFLIFIASQIFWIRRIIDVGERLLPSQPGRRARFAIIVDLAYLFVIAYSFPTTIGQGHTFRVGFYRLPNTVAEAVFWWWFVGSMLAFVLVIVFGIVDRAARAAVWVYCKARRTTQRRVTADS